MVVLCVLLLFLLGANAEDFATIAKDMMKSTKTTWRMINQHMQQQNCEEINRNRNIISIIDETLKYELKKTSQKLRTSEGISVSLKTFSNFTHALPQHTLFELNKIYDCQTKIDSSFELMETYVTNGRSYERGTVKNYIHSTTDIASEYSVVNNLKCLYTAIVPTNKEGIFKLLADTMSTEENILCDTHQSPHQILYTLYTSIVLSELKGFLIEQYSYMWRKLYCEGNFTTESKDASQEFSKRMKKVVKAVKASLEKSSKARWRCDPKQHILSETYEEITPLIQGYIENEVFLNTERSCWETCEDRKNTTSSTCSKDANGWCNHKPCPGRILDCQTLGWNMRVCPSHADSNRRYEYVADTANKIYGQHKECETKKVDSWQRGLLYCRYCFCFCDQQQMSSDKYISLRAVHADVNTNKVITGLRFIKNKRIIHLKIQEGELLPGGKINSSTVRWVPVNNFDVTEPTVQNSVDYYTFTTEEKALDLDDWVAEDGYVLTGIKFNVVKSHVKLQMFATPFNFKSGQLYEPGFRTVGTKNDTKNRILKNLKNSYVPTQSTRTSRPDSQSGEYVDFVNSGIEQDAAQSMVPFFDVQAVESVPPVPLSGVGIFHKGQPGYGGFVAPRILTYDFSKYLDIHYPDSAHR